MSTISTDKIDLVAQMPDGVIKLIVAEVEPWGGDDDQLLALSQKLKTYTAYALDGQLVNQYPEAADKQVVVQLDHSVELPNSIVNLINKANEVYGTPQLKFTVNALA